MRASCFVLMVSLFVLVRVMSNASPARAASPTVQIAVEGHGHWEITSYTSVTLEIASSEPIHISWNADAGSYGGLVSDFRWGWDIRDPSNPEEWHQGWCATCLQEATASFAEPFSVHHFLLEVRDVAGAVTRTQLRLFVYPIGPTLHLSLAGHDSWVVDQGWGRLASVVGASESLQFEWQAEPGGSGAPPRAFRYGWDIQRPDHNAEWQQDWCYLYFPFCLPLADGSFTDGVHYFYLEVSDDAHGMTLARVEITVGPVAVQPSTWSEIKSLYHATRAR